MSLEELRVLAVEEDRKREVERPPLFNPGVPMDVDGITLRFANM